MYYMYVGISMYIRRHRICMSNCSCGASEKYEIRIVKASLLHSQDMLEVEASIDM